MLVIFDYHFTEPLLREQLILRGDVSRCFLFIETCLPKPKMLDCFNSRIYILGVVNLAKFS